VVLLALGILGLIKAVIGLTNPEFSKRVATWWTGLASRAMVIPVALCAALALLVWIAVLAGQPLTHWILLAYGLLFLWGATVYAKPERVRELAHAFIIDRQPYMIRIMSGLLAVLCFLILWVAIRG
jgi:hypothetical protein